MRRLLLIVALCVATQGQTKSDSITLNPEASKAIIAIEREKADLDSREKLILLGASVPSDYACGWDEKQIVTCKKPEAKAGPEKK